MSALTPFNRDDAQRRSSKRKDYKSAGAGGRTGVRTAGQPGGRGVKQADPEPARRQKPHRDVEDWPVWAQLALAAALWALTILWIKFIWDNS